MSLGKNNWAIISILALAILNVSCGGGSSGGSDSASTATRSQIATGSQNKIQAEPKTTTVLALAGTPTTKIYEAQTYTFVPTVSYNGSNTLLFTIANQPAWSTFNVLTGELSGTTKHDDVGTTSEIVISVSDGTVRADLASFNLTIESATTQLSWNAPTTRDDNSALPLAELAGYRIYAGTTPETLALLVDINDADTTQYTITDLSPATYYYTVTAYNVYGIESLRPQPVSKTIN